MKVTLSRKSSSVKVRDGGSALTKEAPFYNLGTTPFSGGAQMKLYLIQHGEAKPEEEDPDRPLTEKGKKEILSLSKIASGLHISPAKVYHSGKLRARQTAEILSGTLNIPHALVQAAQGLNPNDDVRPWAGQISKEKEDLMLVGHLPFLSKLSSLLLCGNENVRLISFRYGAILCLEQMEGGGWSIHWMITPEMAG